MQEELTLALTIRDTLQAISAKKLATQLYRAVEPELLKLVYAKNKDLADIAYHKIRAALYVNLNHDDPTFQKLDDLLLELLKRRQRYLKSPATSFLSFWAEEGWTGGNYALLILPFLLGTLFPPAGIALLIYTIIVTAAAAIDLARKSPEFWLEETSPDTRDLSEQQREAFEKDYADIALFLPENNLSPDPVKTTNYQSYFLYTLVFVIALIALASLLFPPIGIPVIALTALSVVAIAATGMQMTMLYQTREQQLAEIRYERDASYFIKPNHHDSTAVITEILPKRTVTPSPQSTPHETPHRAKKIVPKKEEEDNLCKGDSDEGPHLHS